MRKWFSVFLGIILISASAYSDFCSDADDAMIAYTNTLCNSLTHECDPGEPPTGIMDIRQ